jgi:aspartyl-tRNA(Asn)/glutamyl-tRNA(Gln) amidotransferase subunit C
MKVGEKDVLSVAELAHLELTIAERERMQRDLNTILEYIDRLNELDTSDVPPMSQALFTAGKDGETAMRADEPRPSLAHADALANAPDTDGSYFKVPKVIER